MSQLESLTQGDCPHALERKPLHELGCFYNGLSGKTKQDFIDGNAKYITYMNVYSNPAVNIHTDDLVRINNNEKQNTVALGDILFTTSSEILHECGISSVVTNPPEEPTYLNSFCFGFRLSNLSLFDLNFLKHLLHSHAIRKEICKCASGVTRFNVSKKKLSNVEIPIPSLEEQERIASILDKYSSIKDQLLKQLDREIELTLKQYEYYRDELLSFKDSDAEWLSIEDLFVIRGGYTPPKSNKELWAGGQVPWFVMDDIREKGRKLTDSKQHVTHKAVKKGILFPYNSILLATSATIGEHAILKTEALANQRFTNLSVRDTFKDRLSPDFIFYYMFKVDEWCKKNINISGFASVDMPKLKKYLFPIPLLDDQERIVAILDKYSERVEKLVSNLRREKELVQKQYEYYRDKLLTF